MKPFRFIAMGLCALSIQCGKKQQTWQNVPAPTTEQNLGYIVESSPAQIQTLEKRYPQSKIRQLSKTLFEISHVSEADIKNQLGADIFIEKNALIPAKKSSLSPFKKARTTADAQAAINSCLDRDSTIQLKVDANFDEKTQTINLGESVTIKVSSADTAKPLQILWDLKESPELSQFQITEGISKELSFKPDSVGGYNFVIVGKDAKGHCNGTSLLLMVTDNPLPDTSQQILKIPALEKFKQLFTIFAPSSWKENSGNKVQGDSVIVAVIDSGVNYNHPGIRDNLAFSNDEQLHAGTDNNHNGFKDDFLGWDFANGDNLPFDDDGHGSHVAGLIASPILGVAPKAKILPIKGLHANGASDHASIIASIIYAVDSGARIINMSLTFDDVDNQGAPAALRKAVEYAQSKDVIIVTAAGNGDDNGVGFDLKNRPNYPASFGFDNIIAVSATSNGRLTRYSNFGKNVVHIAAPGGEFSQGLSQDQQDVLYSLTTKNPLNVFFIGEVGTSMATPVTTGVVAQVLGILPNMTAKQARQILMDSGDSLSTLSDKIVSGKQVNAEKAVKMALDLQPGAALM